MHSPIFYRFSDLYAEEKELVEYVSKISSKVISCNQDVRSTNNNGIHDAAGTDTNSKPMILIDKLHEMEKHGEMSHERVHEQILTFLFAVSALTIQIK